MNLASNSLNENARFICCSLGILMQESLAKDYYNCWNRNVHAILRYITVTKWRN